MVTLIGGQVFGGDSGYLYTGTYRQEGDALDVRLHVEQFTVGIPSVMGRTSFDMQVAGTLAGGRVSVIGTVPGTPGQLRGTMTKRGELPPRG